MNGPTAWMSENPAQNMGAEITSYGCCKGGSVVLGCTSCPFLDPLVAGVVDNPTELGSPS